jgi:hypothetical protein
LWSGLPDELLVKPFQHFPGLIQNYMLFTTCPC